MGQDHSVETNKQEERGLGRTGSGAWDPVGMQTWEGEECDPEKVH